MIKGPLKFKEIHPQTPTDKRLDLNVGLRYLDSYTLPLGRRTQERVASYPTSKLASFNQYIPLQSSTS
jgi:hypothetical protein